MLAVNPVPFVSANVPCVMSYSPASLVWVALVVRLPVNAGVSPDAAPLAAYVKLGFSSP